MTIYLQYKPFKCNFEGCSYAAATSSTLQDHIRTHTGDKPFKCNFEGCSYAAAKSCNLPRHIRTHTGNKPFMKEKK